MLFSWKKNLMIHTHTLMATEVYDTAVCQRLGGKSALQPSHIPQQSTQQLPISPGGPAVQSAGPPPGDWAVACQTGATQRGLGRQPDTSPLRRLVIFPTPPNPGWPQGQPALQPWTWGDREVSARPLHTENAAG